MDRHSLTRALSHTPLVVQIWALLLGGLVVAQLVTMLLTLMLPPEPKAQHGLADVAAALRGQMPVEDRPDHLERSVQATPPDLNGAIWLASETSRQQIAQQLMVDPADVRVAFYVPLPFAGLANSAPVSTAEAHPAGIGQVIHAGFTPISLAMFQMSGGGFPSGGMPGGMPGGGMPPPSFPQPAPVPTQSAPQPAPAPPTVQSPASAPPPTPASPPQRPMESGLPTGANGTRNGPPAPSTAGRPGPEPASLPVELPTAQSSAPAPASLPPRQERRADPDAQPAVAAPATAPAVADRTPGGAVGPGAPAQITTQAAPLSVPAATGGPQRQTIAAQPTSLPFVPPRSRGLFGLAPAPNLEGYFVAALRLPDGRWAIVHPAPEPFPNAWQRRVLLWFLIAFAIVAPPGWWFARRIVTPLTRFAHAAEQLGRDPAAEVLELRGPAEIGRAARAFNLMQIRLRSYVDDRTAMIGAISHDLRTPLTRLRFRLEEIDEEIVRESIVGEVEEMEEMIASVLQFLRGASAQGVREVADLGSIVSEVVSQNQRAVGEVVVLESLHAPVEVDRLGIRRIVSNLLENAIKYGDRAKLRVRTEDSDALLEIIDSGPGIADGELEQAFEPFYRSSDPKLAAKSGSGLGLAICRSIARAHGGDVRLLHSNEGFTAQLRIPLASEEVRLEAA